MFFPINMNAVPIYVIHTKHVSGDIQSFSFLVSIAWFNPEQGRRLRPGGSVGLFILGEAEGQAHEETPIRLGL